MLVLCASWPALGLLPLTLCACVCVCASLSVAFCLLLWLQQGPILKVTPGGNRAETLAATSRRDGVDVGLLSSRAAAHYADKRGVPLDPNDPRNLCVPRCTRSAVPDCPPVLTCLASPPLAETF